MASYLGTYLISHNWIDHQSGFALFFPLFVAVMFSRSLFSSDVDNVLA